MRNFDYIVADNLDAAAAEYSRGSVALKAAGIDLLDLMKERVATPDRVLSIGSIADLSYIREEPGLVYGGIRIGCLTTLAEMDRSDLLRKKCPALHEAASRAATPQIRERATLGGNLSQRPRCWYFRSADFNCLKKTGPTCFAVEGENQYHAIFGPGPCHIVHPSNCAPPLVAMDASFIVRGANGDKTREIKAADFFVMPDKSLAKENVLADGDILTEIVIPNPPSQSATIEFREKQSFDWPLLMASVARIEKKWRICLGAVAPIPWLSKEAADVLGDKEITEELATKAGEAAVKGANPMSENGYKIQLVKIAVKRALLAAAKLDADPRKPE